MAPTVRDEIWDKILQRLAEEGEFKISELDIDETKRQTARRVCREMENMRYLKRDSKHSKTWIAGSRANKRLDLSMRAKVAGGYDE